MISFYVRGGIDETRRFLESVKLFTLGESLGAVESLIASPAIMTHASIDREKRLELGLTDATLIRGVLEQRNAAARGDRNPFFKEKKRRHPTY